MRLCVQLRTLPLIANSLGLLPFLILSPLRKGKKRHSELVSESLNAVFSLDPEMNSG